MKRFARLLPWLKNKYVLSMLFFVVWMTFFDHNDFVSQYKYRHELGKLQEDKAYYQTQIEEDKSSIHELMSDPGNLEKFAREKYHMKKADEDVFLIIPPSEPATTEQDEPQESNETEPDGDGNAAVAMAGNRPSAH